MSKRSIIVRQIRITLYCINIDPLTGNGSYMNIKSRINLLKNSLLPVLARKLKKTVPVKRLILYIDY